MQTIFDRIRTFIAGSRQDGKPALLTLVGPTASGKTKLSLAIAKEFGGEIISADSRQIYREMTIGTDKIVPQDQEGIPHHIIDIVDPDQDFTVADFQRRVISLVPDIHRHGHLPMLVGGTGLYISAVVQNYQIPEGTMDKKIRAELEEDLQKPGGPERLYQMLQELDPLAAAKIHPNNHVYLIRALEINFIQKQPKADRKGPPLYAVFQIGIDWPRDVLYERIDRRVDLQIERGLIDEIKSLLARGYSKKLPAISSIGYRQMIAYLDGECTLENAVQEIKNDTHAYARRQLTWFRRDPTIFWITPQEISEQTGIHL